MGNFHANVRLSHTGTGGETLSYQPTAYQPNYSAASTSVLAQHVPSQHPGYYAAARPVLKNCPAVGCLNKVHYDPELGPFDYCSPGCRDVHLLPLEQKRLKDDIEANSKIVSNFWPQSTSSATSSSGSTSGSASAMGKKSK